MANFLSTNPLQDAVFINGSPAAPPAASVKECDVVFAEVDGVTLATFTGSIDAGTIADFDGYLASACATGTGRLVLDMSGVDFLNVEGIALLQDAARLLSNAGGAMAVSGGRAVSRPLRRTGLTCLIPVFDWLPKAFDAVGGHAPNRMT
ncbi:hypothetical protein GOEFS_110_00560 [Gordonia effusa NBRC 100432]|uniref:STAS domain-containing protein n=1 Tax=Gordonia effusa NBRC 100432 TaxID=1077974 RepID=H0R5H6_9ACTN|nr:STAS domain-containing protein [Gordonia effusa]GAB20327.1 hypothetical protein GOEFS_110_00560 [Gordonia effusa NBRC 100432]